MAELQAILAIQIAGDRPGGGRTYSHEEILDGADWATRAQVLDHMLSQIDLRYRTATETSRADMTILNFTVEPNNL